MEENLSKAWSCILQQYTQKIKEDSREEGPGMALFLMKDTTKDSKSPFNCHYRYIEKGGEMWNRFLELSGDKDNIEKVFDPAKHYLVSVHIPDPRSPGETIGSICCYSYDNNRQVY